MNETPPTAGEFFVICVFIQDTHTTAHKENELRKLEYTVRQKDVPCTVGKLMKRQFALTDRQISRLKFMDQGIVLNDRQARTSVQVQAGDRLEIRLEDGHRGKSAKNQRKPETGENSRIRYPEGTEAQKKRAVQKLRILYEDQDLLIVDKPAGMAVHRGRGHYGDTLADRVAKNVLHFHYPKYEARSFLYRGSDERQYNAPGIELPVCAVCRSKYGEYPEYHTSKDDMGLISPSGLEGAYRAYQLMIEALEANRTYRVTCYGEPQLGKRGLYPTISQKGSYDGIKAMTDLITYADGRNDLIAISDRIGVPVHDLIPIAKKMLDAGLFEEVEE